jgi:hypothetical protein
MLESMTSHNTDRKSIDVSKFRETFLGCKAEDTRHILQHMRIGY